MGHTSAIAALLLCKFNLAVLLVGTLSHTELHVFCNRATLPRAQQVDILSSPQAVSDTNSLMQTATMQLVLRNNARSNTKDVEVWNEHSLPPSEAGEEDFPDWEAQEAEEGQAGANMNHSGASHIVPDSVTNVLPATAAVALKDLNDLSITSAKELEDLYTKLHSKVDPKFLQQLSIKTPEIIHEMRLHAKGPLHYPHMHVANHRAHTNKEIVKSKFAPSVASLAPKWSSHQEDVVTLAIVGFVLVGLSNFISFHKKSDKGISISHRFQDVDHGGATGIDKKLTVWDGTITTFTSILGMGFLTLPYAMSLAGWIAGPLMVFFTLCSGYTGHLLSWSLSQAIDKAKDNGKRVPAMAGWGFLLGVSCGPRAERCVNVFLVVELWGYCLSGVVATALNLNQLVDEISVSWAIGLTVLVQFVLTTVPMKTLTKLNVVSNALFLACCLMFIITGFLLPTKAPVTELRWVKPEGIIAACGIIVFSPCAHSLYPSIMQRMEKPKEYPLCIRRAYVLAMIAYVGFAVPGYYLFGQSVQPSAVKNIGADRNLIPLPNLGWMNPVAAFCMVMKMSGVQPLILTPLNSTIESMLQGLASERVLSTLIPPAVLTVSAFVAMHFANQMASLLNLVGSIFCMSIAFVLPVICYWKLHKANVGYLQQTMFFGLIAMGGSFAIIGLLTAVG